MADEYRQDWVVEAAPPSPAITRWVRPGQWQSNLRYARAPACKLFCTEYGSRVLNNFRTVARDADERANEVAKNIQAGGKWTPDDTKKVVAQGLAYLESVGIPKGHFQWLAGERSLVRASQRCAADIRNHGTPRELTLANHVVTARLPIGLAYPGALIRTASLTAEGRWLDIWTIGKARIEAIRPQSFTPDEASYCEAAVLNDGWWVRFIKTSQPVLKAVKQEKMWPDAPETSTPLPQTVAVAEDFDPPPAWD